MLKVKQFSLKKNEICGAQCVVVVDVWQSAVQPACQRIANTESGIASSYYTICIE
jgi:hypothetical protein